MPAKIYPQSFLKSIGGILPWGRCAGERNFPLISSVMLICLLCIGRLAGQNIINTIAGGGSINGPAIGNNADIPGPSSVIADSQGNVYVASPDANQIYEISGGNISLFAGLGWPVEHPYKTNPGAPATSANFNGPNGLAIDRSGDIYITDTAAYIVWKISGNTTSWVAGSGDATNTGDCGIATSAGLGSVSAVATDKAGNVYIADTINNEIWLVNMQSTPIKGLCPPAGLQPGDIAIIAGNKQVSSPQGLFVDSSGNVFISDAGTHRVLKMTPTGQITTYAGTLGTRCVSGSCVGDGGPATSAGLGTPWQLYMDGSGNLYIPDSLQQRVRMVTPATQTQPPMISTFAGNKNSTACWGKETPPVTQYFCGDNGPATSAYLNRPQGVYGDASGNIYIGDAGDQRIRQVVPATQKEPPVISTFAGGGLGDGPALSAILASNQEIALDSVGDIFIADTGNNRIRKLSGGNISTIAGTGVANYYENNSALATSANLSAPFGIALDASGNVYIADTDNYVIRVLNTQSSVITIAGVAVQPWELATIAGMPQKTCAMNTPCYTSGTPARAALLGLPKGIALDSAGNIYFADEAAQVVSEITTLGNIQTEAGIFWKACTNSASGSCGDGGPATSAMLFRPYSVAIDSGGNIYISDAGDNRVRKVDSGTGNINDYAFTGLPGPYFGADGKAALNVSYVFPEYLAFDSRDNLFVSGSSLYYVVARIDASNDPMLLNPVASVAGDWEGIPKYFGYSGDGKAAAQQAQLNNVGVAIDAAENLYISDGGNNLIRIVSSSPTQGLVPVARIMPPTLNFESVQIGSKKTMGFEVGNSGADDLVLGTPSISGPPFSFQSQNPCYGNIVPPDTECIFMVTFEPTNTGQYNGSATIYDNSFGSPSQTVMLTGTGIN